jgi:hypothetical protein
MAIGLTCGPRQPRSCCYRDIAARGPVNDLAREPFLWRERPGAL